MVSEPMATFSLPVFCAFRELSGAIKREWVLFTENQLPSPKESLPSLDTVQAEARKGQLLSSDSSGVSVSSSNLYENAD